GERENTALLAQLRSEAPGILAWCARGCLDWVRNGEQTPIEVLAATVEYREEEDVVGRFIAECCNLGSGYDCMGSILFKAFFLWCERSGEKKVLSSRAFGDRLAAKGFAKKR